MKLFVKFSLVVFALLAGAGCLKVKQLIVVNPDGSGNIVVSTVFPPESVAMMQQMGALQGLDAAAAQSVDLFHDEDALRAAAKDFGEGVVLQKSEKIDRDGSRGSIAVYSFADIRRVKLNTRQNMAMGDAMGALQGGKDLSTVDYIQFAFTTGETCRLSVVMPEFKKAATSAAPAKKTDLPPELAALGALGGGGALGVQMFKGMEMSFAVQVKGEVVATTASHPDGERKDRFILLGMKLDELMTSPEFQKVANAQVTDQGEMMKLLFTLPGANLETNRDAVIEFRAAK